MKIELNHSLKEIYLPYVTIKYAEPIVYCIFHENAELGFPEIREVIAGAEKISNYKPYVTFSDVRGGVNITTEGKRILEDARNMPLFRGTAAIVKNHLYEIAANALEQFHKRPFPYKAFTSEKKAVEWLLSLPLE